MSKKNRDEPQISFKRFVFWILAAIIGTAVTVFFTLLGVANSDHFTIIALDQRTSNIENLLVPRTEYEQHSQNLENTLNRLDKNIQNTNQLIIDLLKEKNDT